MTSEAETYEDHLARVVRERLDLATGGDSPFTEGVHYGDVTVAGARPDGVLRIRFEQAEHPGREFGVQFHLDTLCTPDEIDRAAGVPDPLLPEDVAEFVAIRLDQTLEVDYFQIPDDVEVDQLGVAWFWSED